MKVLGSGPDGMLLEGHEYDIDDGMGKELVDGGYAELIPEPPAAEEEESEEPAGESEPAAAEEPAPEEKPKPKRTRRSRKAAAKESEE